MAFVDLVSRRARMLTEGSVYELLRRDARIRFDPQIAHAGLIYDPAARTILGDVHRSYFEIARQQALPQLAFTDTWRASAARVAASSFVGRAVNHDNVEFLREVADASGGEVFIAGMSGPRGDGYQAAGTPSRDEAATVHRPQIEELAASPVDVLFAATLPALDEALGIGDVMASTGLPWIVSFVVRPDARLLDGTLLADAIRALDAITPPPLGVSLNCVHPSVAAAALTLLGPETAARIIAFQGNSAALAPEELDGSEELLGDDAAQFGNALIPLLASVPIVGGCCGTDVSHIAAVADRCRKSQRSGSRIA